MRAKIYTTPMCPYCRMLKDFLKSHNVAFDEVNVAEDEEAVRYLIERSGQMGVPVTEIDGKIIVGFDLEALKDVLKLK